MNAEVELRLDGSIGLAPQIGARGHAATLADIKARLGVRWVRARVLAQDAMTSPKSRG